MNDTTPLTLTEAHEITERDRMRVFLEDSQALAELAAVVHKKAMEGDNAAGHLDLKIRERRASMHGYDSPVHFDMTLVAKHREPSTAPLERALQRLAEQTPPHRRALIEKVHRGELDHLAPPVIDCKPETVANIETPGTSECTSETEDGSKTR
jgi:hypothetical protein